MWRVEEASPVLVDSVISALQVTSRVQTARHASLVVQDMPARVVCVRYVRLARSLTAARRYAQAVLLASRDRTALVLLAQMALSRTRT